MYIETKYEELRANIDNDCKTTGLTSQAIYDDMKFEFPGREGMLLSYIHIHCDDISRKIFDEIKGTNISRIHMLISIFVLAEKRRVKENIRELMNRHIQVASLMQTAITNYSSISLLLSCLKLNARLINVPFVINHTKTMMIWYS